REDSPKAKSKGLPRYSGGRGAGLEKACGAFSLRLCASASVVPFLRVSASPRESCLPPSGRIAIAGSSAGEGDAEFIAHRREVALDPAFAPDQHVVVVGQACGRQRFAQQFAETALHAVAHDRVADLLRDRHAVALAESAVGPRQQHESGTRNPEAAVGGHEIGAPPHDLDIGRRHNAGCRRWIGLRPAARKAERPPAAAPRKPQRGRAPGWALESQLGAELLAATRAAGTQHLAAARGSHAGEEAVPARADKVARLESALHRLGPEFNENGRPLWGRPSIRAGG